ncbi:MAG: hypothetical protein U0401_11815 [Anaerolineae bacterium]
MQIKPREGTPWSGDWASSFACAWQGPLHRLPGGPLLDHSFDRIIPEYVLTGFSPLDFAAHVYAGLCVGWIHVCRPSAPPGAIMWSAVLTTFALPLMLRALTPPPLPC